ncbi:MAG: biosynthetic-type acetolactate synthase large subunit, partial [bacterium]|nr:biosynthetic-type acetolactate synthase large subunit [bacterium]
LYDALRSSGIRHVLARHEQGGGFIAQGMARATGRAAVCLGTSGPGATNLLTAIADAKLDSVPIIAITGQVPSAMIGTDAFQEVDTYGLTVPITKHNFFVRDAAELLEIIPQSFAIAESDRPGPVVVDVPKDVQKQEIEFDAWPEPWQPEAPEPCDSDAAAQLVDRIHRAERPVLYVGGGVIACGASDNLTAFARKNGIPVTCTLNGLGAFPPDDPLYLGMLGMHGARYTNFALDEADLLIALGVRFDDRATGRAADFCRHADIVHVDIDPSEIDKIKAANLSIAGDVGAMLRAAMLLLREDDRSEWNRRIAELRTEHPFVGPESDDPLLPLNFIQRLADFVEPDTVVTTDVGQHQMWVAQAYPFRRARTLQTSGGLGTMGFGLPAAIGAALARPGERVVCVSGDGSILMNIQELATLAELGLDVTVLIMNNERLGLVRQQQELFYGERYHASTFDATPDFAAIARAFGVRGIDLDDEADPMAALHDSLTAPGPCVVNVPIHHAENVFPMVPPGGANHEMIGGGLAHA